MPTDRLAFMDGAESTHSAHTSADVPSFRGSSRSVRELRSRALADALASVRLRVGYSQIPVLPDDEPAGPSLGSLE